MSRDWSERSITIVVYSVVAIVTIALIVASAHFESATYNRLTGASTTAWDALFVELRVEGQVER